MSEALATFDELLSDICDGRATETQWQLLTSQISEDRSLLDRYLYYLDLHACLSSDPILLLHEPLGSRTRVNSESRIWFSPRHHPWRFVLAVSLVTCLFWAGLAALTSFTTSHLSNGSTYDGVAGEQAATLARTHDVRWAPLAIVRRSREPLYVGDWLEWDAGFMELHYESGASAVIEGPGKLRITGKDQTELKLGKFVAFVPEPAKGFVLHTDTTIFEDLGTEFGVDVTPEGDCSLHVFVGRVRASPTIEQNSWPARELTAGESLSISSSGELRQSSEADNQFVRQLPAEDIVLDLVDLVAGGDGKGNLCDTGIDLNSGGRVKSFTQRIVDGHGRFMPVADSEMIDGAFVIAAGGRVDKIDSGENQFSFPEVTGGSWGSLWAFQQAGDHEANSWVHPLPNGGDRYLAMHSNAGVTLDLAAIRAANPGFEPSRFFSHANDQFFQQRKGLENKIDAWVIVDGEQRFVERGLSSGGETIRVDLPLTGADRFLTLAITDGGDGLVCDFALWRHPQLVLKATLLPVEAQTTKGSD